MYELIGVILGDGYIRYNTEAAVYELQITGDALDDHEYYKGLSDLIEKIAKRKPKVFIKREAKGRSLKLVIYSKKLVEYLIEKLSICYKNKTFNARMPDKYVAWKYSKHILRGLFESDGSLYFSKSKKGDYPTYPRIELTTSSMYLADQIVTIMEQKAFKIRRRIRKSDKTIRVYLSGPCMVEKWIKEIGISSFKKYSRYLVWKRFGYYIPKATYQERLILLGERGTAATAVDI